MYFKKSRHMNSLLLEDLRDNRKQTKALLYQLYEFSGLVGQKTFYKCNVSSGSFCWSVNSHRTDRFNFSLKLYTSREQEERKLTKQVSRFKVPSLVLIQGVLQKNSWKQKSSKSNVNAPLKLWHGSIKRPHANIHGVGQKSPQELL